MTYGECIMRTFTAQNGNFGLVGKSAKKLLTTTALTAAGLMIAAMPAKADNWVDLTTTAGSTSTDLSQANTTTLNLNTTRAIVEGDLDITSEWTVNVNGQELVAIDRENDPTFILGSLNCSGSCFVLDRDGTIFGEGSVVNVGSVVASTGELADRDAFINDGKLVLNNFGDGAVINRGLINVAQGGLAAFVGKTVSNSGIINAKMGTVAMASGEKVTIDMYGDGLFEVAVEGEAAEGLIENTGTIKAEGGDVLITVAAAKDVVDNVINMDGVVDVSSVSVKGGKIVLSGGKSGTVNVSGKLKANGTTGGTITVTGEAVVAKAGAEIDASGAQGGGTILFGGDFQGQGDTPKADYAVIESGATLRADATENGDGGTVVVWSEVATGFYGLITSRGAGEGQGGLVETSSKGYLEAAGSVLALEWLLDPRNLAVVDSTTFNVNTSGGNPNIITTFGTNGGDTSFVTDDTIEASLNAGTSVTLRTGAQDNGDGDIFVNAQIDKTAGGNATLRLEAHDDIEINSSIISTIGALTVELIAEAFGGQFFTQSVNVNAAVTTNGGAFYAEGENININDDVTTGGGNITLIAHEQDVDINSGGDLFSGGGNILIDAEDDFFAHSNATIDSTGSAGDVTIIADGFDLDGTINAGEGTVFIERESNGDISLGAFNGGLHVSQSEIERIDAGALTVGGSNTSEIFVEDVDTTSSTISGLVTLITDVNTGGGDDVNFIGTNVFNALSVSSDDDVIFEDNAIVDVLTGEANFTGDTNDASVGDFIMGDNSVLRTHGMDINIDVLSVLLEDLAEIRSGGGNVTIDTSNAFGGGTVTLRDGAFIDATNEDDTVGGDITINNEGIFFSESANSLITLAGGEILVNQYDGGSLQNVINAMSNTGDGQNTLLAHAGTYTENLDVNQSTLKLTGLEEGVIDGPDVVIEGTVTVNASNFNLDPVVVDALGAAYGLIATGVGADGLVVDGNIFRNSTSAGIFLSRSAATTGTIKNNTFEGSATRGIETGAIGGGYALNVTDNIFGTNGDTLLNGILFNGQIDTSTITVSGGSFDTGSGSGPIDGDSINFVFGVNNGAVVNISDMDIESTDEAVDFHQPIRSGATVTIDGGSYLGGNSGIEAQAVAGELTIKNATIVGADPVSGQGINILGPISGTLTVTDNTITGGHAGIGRNGGVNPALKADVISGTVSISGNTITGLNGDGIELGDVEGAGTVTITDNDSIVGKDNGIEFDAISGGSTVTISGNTLIEGQTTDGIVFKGASPSVSGSSTVTISGNSTIKGRDDGIEFSNNIENSTIGISGNGTITGVNSANVSDAIDFRGLILDSAVTISENTLLEGADDAVQVLGGVSGGTFNVTDNTTIRGKNGDGVHFGFYTDFGGDGVNSIREEAVVTISGNTLIEGNADGDTNNTGGGGDGVLVTGTVNNATFTVSNNTITGFDNGVDVNGHVTNLAAVNILENTNITGGNNGVKFSGVDGGSTVTISGNTLIQGLAGDGVLFGAGSPSVSDSGAVFIRVNTSILGAQNGVRFEDTVDNGIVTISQNVIEGTAAAGISFDKVVTNGSTVTISANTRVEGKGTDGIVFKGSNPSVLNSTVNIIENTTIQGRDDGIEFSRNVETSTINISGNALIKGVQDATLSDAIDFRGLLLNSDIDINGNTNLDGRDDGIQVLGGVSGGTFDVNGNASILGRNGDGIHFGFYRSFNGDGVNSIRNGAVVTISGNTRIEGRKDGDTQNTGGGGDGVLVTGNINASTFNVTGNTTITAFDNGVDVNGKVVNGSTANVNGNTTILGGNNGVKFSGITGESTVNVNGNTSIEGVAGNGVLMSGMMEGSSFNVLDNTSIIGGLNGVLATGDFMPGLDGNAKITVSGNDYVEGKGVHGIAVIGTLANAAATVTVSDNGHGEDGRVTAMVDGIHVENFDDTLIDNNFVFITGDDGIEANTGNFALIQNNTVMFAGFKGFAPVVLFGLSEEEVSLDDDGEGANGILVKNVYGSPRPFGEEGEGEEWSEDSAWDGGTYGYGNYSPYDSIVYNNFVAFAMDDGIEVTNDPIKMAEYEYESMYDSSPFSGIGSTLVSYNDVGHVQDDGIDVNGVSYSDILFNSVSLAVDDGITVENGLGTTIDYNRILAVGDEGIDVESVGQYDPSYSYGYDDSWGGGAWAVQILNNEIAFTGGHGVQVTDSGATLIDTNDIMYAGMGEDLAEFVYFTNIFAADGILNGGGMMASLDEVSVMEDYESESFTWYWGNDDGINVRNVHGFGADGNSLTITNNDVSMTGGDGIDVEDAGRTLIGWNDVEFAGINETVTPGFESLSDLLRHGPFAESERETLWWDRSYDLTEQEGMNDILRGYVPEPTSIQFDLYSNHDGIRAKNVFADGYSSYGDGYFSGYDGYGYGSYGDYSLTITGNYVSVTADDGIEVVGEQGEWYYGTGRTLISENHVMHTGIKSLNRFADDGYNGGDDEGSEDTGFLVSGDGYDGYNGYEEDDSFDLTYGNGDEYGADGIHARGVFDNTVAFPAGTEGGSFYGYDVDVLNNIVHTTTDDGVEVIHSGSTLIDNNDIYNIGVGSGGYYGGADYYGADGIHVRNVYDSFVFAEAGYIGDGEEHVDPYSVVIRNNYVNHTQDDGIEVVHSGRTWIDNNEVYNAGVGYIGGYYGYYGGINADGYGADGIHVREVVAFGRRVIDEPDFDPYFGLGDIDADILSVTITNNKIGHLPGESMEEVSELLEGEDPDSFIPGAADDGIQVLWSGNTLIDTNDVANSGTGGGSPYYGLTDKWGADGIHVLTGYFHNGLPDYNDYHGRGENQYSKEAYGYGYGYPYFLSTDVQIVNNMVVNSADDGIETEGVTSLLIDNNIVDQSGDDGIKVIGYAGFFEGLDDVSEEEDESFETALTFGVLPTLPSFEAIITNNTVTNSGTPFPVIEALVEDGGSFGGDGIHVENYDFVQVSGNTVENSVEHGLFSSGPFNGTIEVFDNVFTDNDVHAEFQSGLVDLTGLPGNTFNGGRIGLRFNPFEFGNEEFDVTSSLEVYDWYYYPFGDLPEEGFAELLLVDNDGPGSTPFTGLDQVPTNFAGTIGSQFFNGQSQFFVEALGNFYQTPFWLNALNSTFVTPTGNVTPASTGGVLDVDTFNFLNDRFFDFRDFSGVGIFFFGFIPSIDQEDIFNFFDPANLELSGLNVTILGLPNVPGAPQNLANIIPFAGGEDGTPAVVTPESLNAIQTAAGEGQQAPCWGDAVNTANTGGVVNFTYGTGFDETVDDAAVCATTF